MAFRFKSAQVELQGYKKWLSAPLLALMLGGAAQAQTVTFRIATVNPPTHESVKVVDTVAKRITERTEGRVKFQMFPSAQLGSSVDSLEQASQNQPIITYVSASFLAPFGVPELSVFDGPYVFTNKQEAERIVFSPFANELYDQLAKKAGIRVLALNWSEGARHMIGNAPYPKPENLKGVKVRMPPVKAWIKTFEPIGAVPTTVEAAETYSALSQGVVAAAEAPLVAFRANRWYEVAKHITLTGHFYLPNGWATSEATLNKLSEGDRKIVLEEFRKGGPEMVARSEALEAEIRKTFEAQGVTFHQADTEAYRKATAPFYDSFPEWPKGLYEKLRAAATAN